MGKYGRTEWRRAMTVAGLAMLAWSGKAEVLRVNLDARAGTPEIRELGYPVARAELTAGGERVVGVEIEGETVVMTPLQEGRATVYVFDRAETERDRLEVFVHKGTGPGPLDVAVRSVLVDSAGRPLPGLAVAPVEGRDKARVTGRVENRAAFYRLEQARAVFGEALVDLTEPAPGFREWVLDEARERIGNGNIEVGFAGRDLFLQGLAFSEAEKAFIESAARAVYPRVQSFIGVRPWSGPHMPRDVVLEKPLVLLECRILEITFDALKEMGIEWGGMQTLTAHANWSAASARGALSSISLGTAKLFQLLTPHMQNGNARVLYTQNLVCEDGEWGKFFAGGSFHIVVQPPGGGHEIAVKEVEYGISMEIEPKTDRHGNVETAVRLEFSSLGPVIHLYPSLHKRYVQTTVNVKQGQTLSLGALIGHSGAEDISKVPGLGDIPVLGELFKSRNYRDKKSELVFMITPRRVAPGEAAEADLRQGLQRRLEPGAVDGTDGTRNDKEAR